MGEKYAKSKKYFMPIAVLLIAAIFGCVKRDGIRDWSSKNPQGASIIGIVALSTIVTWLRQLRWPGEKEFVETVSLAAGLCGGCLALIKLKDQAGGSAEWLAMLAGGGLLTLVSARSLYFLSFGPPNNDSSVPPPNTPPAAPPPQPPPRA